MVPDRDDLFSIDSNWEKEGSPPLLIIPWSIPPRTAPIICDWAPNGLTRQKSYMDQQWMEGRLNPDQVKCRMFSILKIWINHAVSFRLRSINLTMHIGLIVELGEVTKRPQKLANKTLKTSTGVCIDEGWHLDDRIAPLKGIVLAAHKLCSQRHEFFFFCKKIL